MSATKARKQRKRFLRCSSFGIPSKCSEAQPMRVIKEFRDFAIRGNVVDLAVGVVIGAAFGKIVTSLVGDIIMPAVGQLVGGIDLSRYKLVLRAAASGKEEVA